MSEKVFWVGSVGPLLYDDTEKNYEDSDMLEDDIVSPLQRALWAETPDTATNLPITGEGSDTIPPSSPSGLYLLSSGMGGIIIGWVAPADADIDNYSIYWSTSSTYEEGVTTLVGTVPAPATTFTHVYTHPLTTAFTCYYWVKALDKSKNVSLLAGPLTVAATTTYDDAINKTVNALAETPVENGVSFKTNKFTISPPGSETISPTAIFTVGTIDGNPSIAIRGDLFVTGSINGNVITADTIVGSKINAQTTISLTEGGTLKLGYSGSDNKPDIEVVTNTGNGQGKLIVYDGVSNSGYNSTTEFWRSTVAHYVSTSSGTTFENPPRRMITGYCKNRSSVTILGDFPHMPQVQTWPMTFPTNSASPMIICHPGNLYSSGYGSWYFSMYCSVQSTGTYVRSMNEDYMLPFSNFAAGSTITTTTRTFDPKDIASYTATRFFVKVSVRANNGSNNGSLVNLILRGIYSGGGYDSDTTQVYADTDWRSYWLIMDSSSNLYGSFYLIASYGGLIPSRYRWPYGTGKIEVRVELSIAYPTIPAASDIIGAYLAYF